MAKVYETPGVYIEEESAFPNSAVQVATAVPAFIGYTEKAIWNNQTLNNKPTKIKSLEEYHERFGYGPKTTCTISPHADNIFENKIDKETHFYLYHSMRLFFANGGSTCYIVSVADSKDYSKPVSAKELIGEDTKGGIESLLKFPEPTMVVVPDAMLLDKDQCANVQKKMMSHCGTEKNRVAILDAFEGFKPKSECIEQARELVGDNFLMWSSMYYPFLNTSILATEDIDFRNIKNKGDLKKLLDTAIDEDYEGNDAATLKKATEELEGDFKDKDGNLDVTAMTTLHQKLLAKVPLYKDIMKDVVAKINLLPPSGAMAGIISMIDGEIGVHQSPANVSLGSVVSPAVSLTTKDQADLNLPLDGKAVNAIRAFPGKGVLVWGARTLDGNSQDWRYISVRRTVIMIEQSLKIAAGAYVFEPNVANTWVAVKGMMNNFLKDQWKAGALAGASPEDAYRVDIGLGVTMTPTDILNGIMKVSVKLAVTRPAEFIVITFQQQMQQS